MKVCIFLRRLPHYRIDFFETLRKNAYEENIFLDVYFGQPRADEISKCDSGHNHWAKALNINYINNSRIGKIAGGLPSGYDLVILPHEAMLIDISLEVFYRKIGRYISFWGHGRNFQANNPNSLVENYKKILAKKADYWFSYNALSTQSLENINISTKKIFEVGNTVKFKQELKKTHIKKNALFIGSLYKNKRIDFLLDAARCINKKIPDFTLSIVGDGPEAEKVRYEAGKSNFINYLGAITDNHEKAKLYQKSSIVMCPGLVGLNIVEAIKTRTPILTTIFDKHSPEIDYLNDNNGLMTDNNLCSYVDGCISTLSGRQSFFIDEYKHRKQLEYLDMNNMVSRFLYGLITIKEQQNIF